MTREVTFINSFGAKRRCSDVGEMGKIVRELKLPGMYLITNLHEWNGYLDFSVQDDYRLEMEIWEYESDFGILDTETAARVIKIAMTDELQVPLKQKLSSLNIEWLT